MIVKIEVNFMACGEDCSAKQAAEAEYAAAEEAVAEAQTNVDNMLDCIEVYVQDIAELEEIGQKLEASRNALLAANQSIAEVGTINGERVDGAIG